MRRFYLVDLENVGSTFIKDADCLSIEDTVIVFHSKTDREPWQTIKSTIESRNAKFQQIPVYSQTKNALDFQLTAHLGYLIGKNETNTEYYIVSRDVGYMAAVEFLKRQMNTNIEMIGDFSSIKKKNEIHDRLKEILQDFPDKVIRSARKSLNNSTNLNEYHIALQRAIPRDADKVYSATKEYACDIYGIGNMPEAQSKKEKKKYERMTRKEGNQVLLHIEDKDIDTENIAGKHLDRIKEQLFFLENKLENNTDVRDQIADRLMEFEQEARKCSKSPDDYFGIKAAAMHTAVCTARNLI